MSRVQGESEEGEQREPLPPISAWKKIIVSFAGALGNVVFAIAIAWLVYWQGIPATLDQRSAAVGYVDQESPAYERGLRTGDTVLSVNGQAVNSWSDVMPLCMLGGEVSLEVDSPEGRKELVIPVSEGAMGQQSIAGVSGRILCLVDSAMEGLSAAEAGIMRGDIIERFDGVEVLSIRHLNYLVSSCRDETVDVEVRRRDELVVLQVTPRYSEEQETVLIGVEFGQLAYDFDSIVHPKPMEQIKGHSTLIFRVLKALVTPKTSKTVAKQVGGAGAILAYYWYVIPNSLMLAIWFTGLLNINLAILNLLPIPVLDGGHIMFSLWEGITKRPVNAKFMNFLVNVFAVLLISLLFLLLYRDVVRFTPIKRYVGRLFGRDSVEQVDADSAEPAPANTTTNEIVP
jgi:regulator of sigma E protease